MGVGTQMPVEITKRRFDVDDYHRMAKAGILHRGDRVELIDGEIVAMTPIGPRHNAAVDRALRMLVAVAGDQAIVRVQGSIRLSRFHEPQPDIVLLRPRNDFYASQLPGAADTLLVIEIAESSLEYDRQVKGRIYAEAGIPEYWLVDLERRILLRFATPKDGVYQRTRETGATDSVAPELLPSCVLRVSDLLAD